MTGGQKGRGGDCRCSLCTKRKQRQLKGMGKMKRKGASEMKEKGRDGSSYSEMEIKWRSSIACDTEYCQFSPRRLTYKQADTPTANEVCKLMRTARCLPNVPVTHLLMIMCMFRKTQRWYLSWAVMMGSCAAVVEGL